ncbi:MAG: DUF433 domain-containing protein [Pirellulales bacterium]
MSTVSYPHIEVRENGKAYINGTGFKVRMLVEEHLAGVSPAEMEREHPQLTLSQIYSALAFYHDHKREIDDEMAELTRFAEEFRAQQGESLMAKKLREMGKELP